MPPASESDISPEEGGDFPEEHYVRNGSMREEIINMAIVALNEQDRFDMTVDSVNRNDQHRNAFLDLLRDCRPLPIVLQVIADAEARNL